MQTQGGEEDRGVPSPRGRTMFFAADTAVAAWLLLLHVNVLNAGYLSSQSQSDWKNAGYHLWVLERNPGLGKCKTFTRTSKPVWPLLWRKIMCLLRPSAIQRCLKNSLCLCPEDRRIPQAPRDWSPADSLVLPCHSSLFTLDLHIVNFVLVFSVS